MQKAQLRKIYLEKRKELSEEENNCLSAQLFDLLLKHFDLDGKTVSLFLPILIKRELNTTLLLQKTANQNIQFSFPVASFDTYQMKHIAYLRGDDMQLKTNNFGIPEPQYGEIISPAEIDLVIVPLLCADKRGYRVGYGKGFYDRFLKDCRQDCLFIGISQFELVDDIADIDPYDIQLHYHISPTTITKFQ